MLGVEGTLTFPEELVSLLFREYDGKMLKNGASKHSEMYSLFTGNLLFVKILTRKIERGGNAMRVPAFFFQMPRKNYSCTLV